MEPAANFVAHFQLPSKLFMNASSSLEGRFSAGGAGGGAAGALARGLAGVATFCRVSGFVGIEGCSKGS
jgi:hypothetical protein